MSIGDRAAAILQGVETQGLDYFNKSGRGVNATEEADKIQSDYIHSLMREASATNGFNANLEKYTVTLKVEGSLNDLSHNPEKRRVVAVIPRALSERGKITCSNVLGAKIVSQCNQYPFEIGFNFNGSIPVNSQYIGTSAKSFDYVFDTTNGEVSVNTDLFSLSAEDRSNVIQSPFEYLSVMTANDIREEIVNAEQEDMIVLKSNGVVAGIASTINANQSSGETFVQGPQYCVVSKDLGNQAIRQAYHSVERAKKEVFDFSNISAELERIDNAQFNDINQICDGNGFVAADQAAAEYRKAFIRIELDVCTKYVPE